MLALTVASTGALLGSGLSALLAASLVGPVPRLPPLVPFAPLAAAPDPPGIGGGLFPPVAPDPPDGPAGPAPPTACAPGWRLVGALVVPRHPERSIAAVRAPDGAAVLAPAGHHAGHTLVGVHHAAAVLRRDDGTECLLPMFTPHEAPPPDQTAGPPEDPAVTRVGAHHFRVERAAVLAARRHAPTVRLQPVTRGGQLAGARVLGARPGTLVHRAGVRSGDVIRAVDGAPLHGPAQGVEAWGRLMRGEPVRVTVTRDGRSVELTWELTAP